jgi:predicted nucleic acid-binding protein
LARHSWQKRIAGPKLTTEFVLFELLDALTSERLRAFAVAVVDLIRRDATIEVPLTSSALLDNGFKLFRARTDKRWGLTDCISFSVMSDAGVTDALTADHHFEQAGYKALLLQNP